MMLYGMRQSVQWQHLDQLALSGETPLFRGLSAHQVLSRQQWPVNGINLTNKNVIMAGENRSLVGLMAGLGSALNNKSQVVMTGNQSVGEIEKISQWYPESTLVIEDQVLLQNSGKAKKVTGLKQVLVHSYDQESRSLLDSLDLQSIFGDVQVEKVMSNLE